MADLEEALRDVLVGTPAVTAIVGTDPGSRIYPLTRPPKSALPALTYGRVSTTRISSFASDTGLLRARIQVSVWAETMAAVWDLATVVIAALKRLTGSVGSPAVAIDTVLLVNEGPDIYEPDASLYQRPLDFEVWHQGV